MKRLACKFCGDTIDASNRDTVLNWDHSHPAVCPGVHDRVPALNGVHVGDLWMNSHTRAVDRVMECRLGGAGVYTTREPCIVLAEIYRPPHEGTLEATKIPPDLQALSALEPSDEAYWSVQPLWGLVEHWEPLTRPGEWPVPWEPSERFHGHRSVPDEWRGPAYRHSEEPGRDEQETALYWHAFHTVIGWSIQWEETNRIWQVDPDSDPSLLAVPPARVEKRRVVAPARERPEQAKQEKPEALF